MARRSRLALVAIFALTGFSALTLQVVWQRVISMHAGVDLLSFATVVSAFLAGLGFGSVAGGWLADRLGPRRSVAAFALSNAGIGVFAWFSVWLFYDVYRSVAPSLSGTLGSFGFNVALLIVPTTLMGLSLPLIARGVVQRIDEAGPLVGRLYAVNTLGAGIGAAVSGWLLVGNLGFVGTTRLAGTTNLVAAVLIGVVWKTAAREAAVGTTMAESALVTPGAVATAALAPAAVATALAVASGPGPTPPPPRPEDAETRPPEPGSSTTAAPAGPGGRAWPWFVAYALTGAVALGLEVVFFRLVDAIMRSNSYTFGHVLMLYLLLFGGGAAVASRLVGRVRRPDRWFLWLQFGVGVTALLGPLVLIEMPELLGIDGPIRRQFAIDGYNLGQYRFWPLGELTRLLFVHLGAPLLVMGAPVLLMGASFPFVQALVAQRAETLGRRTGVLLCSNIAGNVVGTLVVGFVLIDWIGSSGTLRLLAGLLLIPGIAAAMTAGARTRRAVSVAAAVAVLGAALAVFPSNRSLWEFLHSAQSLPFELAEERACVNALRPTGDEELLFINATSQNGYPFDEFHVLIGLLPALTHPDPSHALAVGLGIGATPFGMTLDPRLSSIDVVEICGGEIDLLERLASRAPEIRRLFADDRVDIAVGDGRKHLLSTDDRFDVLTVDVIRPQSAFSGNLYSVEFYELVRSRLARGGIFAQWAASARTVNSATQVFPYVLGFTIESYTGSQFMLASMEPIPFDRELLVPRFEAAVAGQSEPALAPRAADDLRRFLAAVEPVRYRDGGPAPRVPEGDLNRDLFPRDEYFLNDKRAVEIHPAP